MRHQADLGAGRQGGGQLQGILDRAFRQRAVLEGVNAAGKAPFQRRPQVLVAAAQVAKTAERAGRGAVDENQDRMTHRVRHGAAGAEIGGTQRRPHAVSPAPAVQAGAGIGQPAFDGHHQGSGAGPADAQLERASQERRLFQHRIGPADDQGADFPEQPAGRLAEQAARLRAFHAQLLQQHRAVRAQQLRPAQPQAVLQPRRAADEDAAVAQFQHHHFVGQGLVPLLGRAGRQRRATGQRVDLIGLARGQKAGGEERIVQPAAAHDRVQQRRQPGIGFPARQGQRHWGLRIMPAGLVGIAHAGSLRAAPSCSSSLIARKKLIDHRYLGRLLNVKA